MLTGNESYSRSIISTCRSSVSYRLRLDHDNGNLTIRDSKEGYGKVANMMTLSVSDRMTIILSPFNITSGASTVSHLTKTRVRMMVSNDMETTKRFLQLIS